MQPESGGICEGLTQDLPLGYLQGGDGQGQILGVAFRKSPEHVLGFPLSPVTVQRPGSRHGGPNRCRANSAKTIQPRQDSGLLPESQGQHLAFTVFHVPHSLDSGTLNPPENWTSNTQRWNPAPHPPPLNCTSQKKTPKPYTVNHSPAFTVTSNRCRANLEQISHSRPDSGIGFQVKCQNKSLGGVPREHTMLKGHLLRVTYHQVY